MAKRRDLVTAEELDRMTPDQRSAVVLDRIVTEPAELPEELRARIFETGQRIADQIRTHRQGA